LKRAESDVTDLSDLGVSMVEELDQLFQFGGHGCGAIASVNRAKGFVKERMSVKSPVWRRSSI
jgi:hypothetical protein